jgi:hypothetical protein
MKRLAVDRGKWKEFVEALLTQHGEEKEEEDLYLFNFPIVTSFSDMFGSGTNGSAVCVSVCLILPPPVHSNSSTYSQFYEDPQVDYTFLPLLC